MSKMFPHLKPLTDKEMAQKMAEAVWNDLRDTYYGPALLRKHHSLVNGRPAYRFPYEDRAYLLHRDAGADTWAVTLYAAPSAEAPAATVSQTGILVTGQLLQKDAVTQLVSSLYGTRDDHGYTRGQDSCPGCDHFKDTVYDTLA